MTDITAIADRILTTRRRVPAHESTLFAVSGIDGSGKGYVSGLIAAELENRAVRAAVLNIDCWHHLPVRRFSKDRPAEHFYQHAFRFTEMFDQLVLPLKRRRSVRVEADLARIEETFTDYYRHTYDLHEIDVIVLEGAFLLKRELRHHYDLTLWVDCTIETALDRALQRGQEGLSPEETVRAYETIFFAAQRIHFERDEPRAAADVVVRNDPRLSM